jgi:uncharacterized membrane protein YoaK (UPF0700 family)
MRRLLELTEAQRTPQGDRTLGAVLAFNAGAINAGGFLIVHAYTSHMTGFVSLVADNLVLGNLSLVLAGVGALLSFTLGAMSTAILVNWTRRRHLHSTYALPLLLEAALLLVFGLVGATFDRNTPFAVPLTLLLLAFLMGLQNAVITKISSAQVRTTHMTGILTDLGIELGKLVYWNRSGDASEPDVVANRSKLSLFSLLLGMFLLGGIVGATGFKHLGFASVLPLALALLALCLPPIVRDLRGPRVLRV